jgi:hypothetical protein
MKSKRFATVLLIFALLAVIVLSIYISMLYSSNSKSSSYYAIKAPIASQSLAFQSSTTPSNSYYLWINAVAPGCTTPSAQTNHSYAYGANVYLTASPTCTELGQTMRFCGWSGPYNSTASSIYLLINNSNMDFLDPGYVVEQATYQFNGFNCPQLYPVSNTTSNSFSVSLSISPNPVLVGSSIHITATWSGGIPPYTATLFTNYADVCSGSASSASFAITTENYTDTPVEPGEYYCEIVTDSSGNTARAGPIFVSVSNTISNTPISNTPVSNTPIGKNGNYSTNATVNNLINHLLKNRTSSATGLTLTIQNPSVTYGQLDAIIADTGTSTDAVTLVITETTGTSIGTPIVLSGGTPTTVSSIGTASYFICAGSSSCLSPGTYSVSAKDTVTGATQSGTFTVYSQSCPPPFEPQPTTPGSESPTVNAYNQQYVLLYSKDTTSLDYIITANEQPEQGYGGATYLLNGLGSTGCWYQFGISYDWPGSQYPGKFVATIEVINSSIGGSSEIDVFGPGVEYPFFDGPGGNVNPGDKIELRLWIPNPNPLDLVYMSANDLTTGAYLQTSYPAYGATTFLGTPNIFSAIHGTFTGPMTEQYFKGQPFYGPPVQEVYVPNGISTIGSSIPSSMHIQEVCQNNPDSCVNPYITDTEAPITPSPSYVLSSGILGEQLFSNGNFVTGLYNPPALNLQIQQNPVDYGLSDIISASVTPGIMPSTSISVPLQTYTVNIIIGGVVVATGINTVQYDICPPGSSTCFLPGSYSVSASASLPGISLLQSDTQILVVNPSECEQPSVPVSGLVESGSAEPGDFQCLCPATKSYVDPGQQCQTSQVCPPGSAFNPSANLTGEGCTCPGNQFVSIGTSSCPTSSSTPKCGPGESLLPIGVCGCTNGIPNAQGACTVCQGSSVPALNAANGQYYCASANPPQCSALTASSNQECVCNNVNMVQNPSMCTAPPKPPLCEDATSGQSCSCTSSGTIVSDPSLCGLPSCDSVGSGQACICADGTTVTDLNDCPAPTCDDGNTAPSTGCVTCPDGSTASSLTNCPSSVGGGNSTGGGNNTNIPPSEDADVVARTKLCTNPLTAWECNWFSGI